ncbi:energy transducer TonB family protein [Enterovirga rhinocerotis]|uniref:Outer membrane transport energization protein TonB n=1 Tax=Enterovirga rhinocerotis TaxID=1339210 RepID=A0A4R7BP35_9HYPH|nr:energy transducer TonB [Enterovirga rhinocerotis]TDR87320.1 outer membrane transport energization protein TonB [Enterovirga rhinocerotis]
MAEPSTAYNRRRSRTAVLWAGAFLLALGIHAAAIAAAVRDMNSVEADDEDGAPAIEIGIELTSTRNDQTDLPPGPESEASEASTAQVEQTAVTEKTNLPQDTPVESDDPDRVVTTDTPEKPKEEEEPTPTARPSTASQESVAAEATAPPTIDKASEAPKSTAPVQGTGSSTSRVVATWHRRLSRHLDRNKRYPGGAKHSLQEVTVSFTIDRTGKLITSSVVKSSGEAAFDEAALAMLRRADPLPAPPPVMADEGLTFTLPVHFKGARG